MATARRVVHVDMDAFYAAIEQLDHPAYRGLPIVVGADPKGGKGRGVVSTCSYEARPFGVRSAMPISQAYRLCPQAVYLPVRMARYQEISARIFAIFRRYTEVVEPLSIDEAFLDVSASTQLFGPVEAIARRLESLGMRTIGQVAHRPLAQLRARFGNLGAHIWRLSRGIDERSVKPHREPKSIGAEATFATDTSDQGLWRRTLLELAERVARRLRADAVMAARVTLKFRDADFVTLTRTRARDAPTAAAIDLFHAAEDLLWTIPGATWKVRLLGISASEFTPVGRGQLSLFAEATRKRLRAERAVDAVRARFGPHAITRATLLGPQRDLTS
jgi:nucleotidyltransferase/DNA polymerase involved in DNA repair